MPTSLDVLLVDSEVHSKDLVDILSCDLNHFVKVIHDGSAAIKICCSQRPHVVLVRMEAGSKYNALELCEQIKNVSCVIFVVLLVDGGSQGIRLGTLPYIDFVINAPYTVATMEGLIQQINVRYSQVIQGGISSIERSEKKVLVIDDDFNALEYMKQMISPAGYEVSIITDGKSGLELIKSGVYVCVFLDLVMPNFSGLDVVKSLPRQMLDNIFMISGYFNSKLISRCSLAGVKHYIDKPIQSFSIKYALDSV